MPFPVKNFLSTDTGLGGLTSTLGNFIDILHKCLVAGFNTVSVSAATYSIENDLFTITLPTGHGYRVDQILVLSGAAQAGYNVELRVVTTGPTTVTAVSHSSDAKPTVTTATGTMSIKAAPQGTWTRPYTGTNKAVFKINAAGSSGCYLRIDNSLANSDTPSGMKVGVEAYELMTDVDSGTSQFSPNDVGYNFWGIRARTSYRDSPFVLISDSRCFYFHIKVMGTSGAAAINIDDTAYAHFWRRNYFGDIVSLHPTDTMCCALSSNLLANGSSDVEGNGQNCIIWQELAGSGVSFTAARNIYGTVGKKLLSYVNLNFTGMTKSGFGPLAYPQIANSALVLCDTGVLFRETVPQLRGKAPGIWTCPQNITQATQYVPTSKIDLNGRQLMNCWWASVNTTTVPTGPVSSSCDFIDITGPWR